MFGLFLCHWHHLYCPTYQYGSVCVQKWTNIQIYIILLLLYKLRARVRLCDQLSCGAFSVVADCKYRRQLFFVLFLIFIELLLKIRIQLRSIYQIRSLSLLFFVYHYSYYSNICSKISLSFKSTQVSELPDKFCSLAVLQAVASKEFIAE